MMKKYLKNISVFVSICVVISLLLAVTNHFTAPIIEKNQAATANAALLEVMPDGKGFDELDISTLTLPKTVTKAYKETSGIGYVLELTTSGYKPDMIIMCGVTTDGTVTGAVCIAANETWGLEKTYGENFKGKDAAGVDAVALATPANKTTTGYKNAIRDALNAAIILGGGSADIRTEEEILADNLSAALPAGDTFEKVFITEELEGVDSIYKAANDAGYVVVIGEEFIATDIDGVSENETASAAVGKIKASTLKDINIENNADLSAIIFSAKKTASGVYVIEAKGNGYSIVGHSEYTPTSETYIKVRVAIAPNGKILDCLTVEHDESKGFGDACAKPEFYSQFIGKNSENYTEIDGISGATITTNGYKTAIARAYEAVAILKGGK